MPAPATKKKLHWNKNEAPKVSFKTLSEILLKKTTGFKPGHLSQPFINEC